MLKFSGDKLYETVGNRSVVETDKAAWVSCLCALESDNQVCVVCGKSAELIKKKYEYPILLSKSKELYDIVDISCSSCYSFSYRATLHKVKLLKSTKYFETIRTVLIKPKVSVFEYSGGDLVRNDYGRAMNLNDAAEAYGNMAIGYRLPGIGRIIQAPAANIQADARILHDLEWIVEPQEP